MKLPSRKLGRGRAFKLPDAFCPRCARLWDGAGNPDGRAQPRPGDLAVCIGCAGINAYDASLRLRPVDAAELAAEDPELVAALKKMQRTVVVFIAETVAETGEPPRGKPELR